MAVTDYDAPREAVEHDSLEELAARAAKPRPDIIDPVDDDRQSAADLPDAQLSTDEELTVPVEPMRHDELRCSRCFLVYHRSQAAGAGVCGECG